MVLGDACLTGDLLNGGECYRLGDLDIVHVILLNQTNSVYNAFFTHGKMIPEECPYVALASRKLLTTFKQVSMLSLMCFRVSSENAASSRLWSRRSISWCS